MSAQPKFTPGPWVVGQYSDTMGYDCMTGGVRAGPVVLDGADYGQKPCVDLHMDDHFRMMADAHLIASAPDMFAASPRASEMLRIAAKVLRASSDGELKHFYDEAERDGWCIADDCEAAADAIDAALAKARGQA